MWYDPHYIVAFEVPEPRIDAPLEVLIESVSTTHQSYDVELFAPLSVSDDMLSKPFPSALDEPIW